MRSGPSAIARSAAPRGRARHQPLLGGLLVREGLIDELQLERVLTLQEEIEPRPLLGQLLLAQRLVMPSELHAVLGKYDRDRLLGDVLIETKAIKAAELETALTAQRKTDAPLGETLVELGFITEWQLKHALSIQLRIAFVDLDDRAIDPELASLISESYARHHRVMPIARVDDRIVLAMADPTDVERVAELRACTGQGIDVVTATADALERALARAYGARGEPTPPRRLRVERDDAAAREPMARGTSTGSAPERDQRGHATTPAPAPPGRESARPGPALAAVRARMDPFRQLARTWARWADSVEGLLGERGERWSEIRRLMGELRESREAHGRTTRELEAKAEALTRLQSAHAAVVQEWETLRDDLGRLRERHDALLRERRQAIDHLEATLQRLRS